ncbi:MAG: pyridoxamine 5'-phosphate oxidase family protein [Gammaproteobacteria bacterium]
MSLNPQDCSSGTISIRDQALRYIESHNVMSIATYGASGPWNAAVFYLSDGFQLIFVSSPDSRHCQDIAHDSRVAITIQEEYDDWQTIKGIQMEGTTERITMEQQKQTIERYKRKFSFLDDPERTPENIITALESAAWYRVTPRSVFFIDNEKGFGYRTEIPLDPCS